MWRAARTDWIHTAAGVEPLLVASQYDAKTLALHSEQSLAAAQNILRNTPSNFVLASARPLGAVRAQCQESDLS